MKMKWTAIKKKILATTRSGDYFRNLNGWLRYIHTPDNAFSHQVENLTRATQQAWNEPYQLQYVSAGLQQAPYKEYGAYRNEQPVAENNPAEEKIRQQKEISETVIRALEKERSQIGRELHDNVNQLLSATKLFVDVLTPQGEQQQLIKEKSIAYIQLAIDEIRKYSKELVAPQLKEEGIVDCIRFLIEDLELVSPIRIRFTHDLETDLLSQGKKITLFRVVQEQLKNILKHSQATAVSIFLQNRHDRLQLVIQDNGIGFDSKKVRRGIGLCNIEERVKFYNGTVDIRTAPGKGCEVEIFLPVQE